MRTSRAAGDAGGPQGTPRAAGERGALLMFVLLVMLLIAAITLTVMQIIAADEAAGIREMAAVQVFNNAEAGIHYAIGQLQQPGAGTYAGQTITITSGATTLGTATITVNCIDTGAAPPCSGTWASYRRIISVGALPTPGSTRTIVAVVQGTQAGTLFGICTGSTMSIDSGIMLHSNIGANGSISLGSGARVLADTNTPKAYTGLATAVGTISCADGCGTQVAGGATPGAASPVCPAVTLPTFSPGTTDLDVATGFTMDGSSGHGYTWRNVTVESGIDLKIQADPSNPNAVRIVNFNSLTMNSNSRLIILGVGKIDLRIALTSTPALFTDSGARFGVLSTDTPGTPAPVPASQLTVSLRASGSQAVDFKQSAIIAGTFLVPNGEIFLDSIQSPGNVYGSFQSSLVTFNSSGTFYSDTSGIQGGTSSFNNLRSWKDQ